MKQIAFQTVLIILAASFNAPADNPAQGVNSTMNLRARIEASPRLPFHCEPFLAKPPEAGWQSGAVSGVAVGKNGNLYEIQRGENSAPVLVLDSTGRVLDSWGKGNYTLPHSIRLDARGRVWTVDAASSTIIEYSPAGRQLMTIHVGGQPKNGSAFDGTTDIAFGKDGHLFIADGYGNARILEYTSDGKKIREWGQPGSGAGDFHLPHSIQIGKGTVYVADRENGRIEKFSLNGNYLGLIPNLGRIYSIRLIGDLIWVSMGALEQPPGAAGGWIIKLNSRTGEILGHLDIPEPRGGHSLDLSPSGEPIVTLGNGLLWCKADSY